jgi:hypothetical protein
LRRSAHTGRRRLRHPVRHKRRSSKTSELSGPPDMSRPLPRAWRCRSPRESRDQGGGHECVSVGLHEVRPWRRVSLADGMKRWGSAWPGQADKAHAGYPALRVSEQARRRAASVRKAPQAPLAPDTSRAPRSKWPSCASACAGRGDCADAARAGGGEPGRHRPAMGVVPPHSFPVIVDGPLAVRARRRSAAAGAPSVVPSAWW